MQLSIIVPVYNEEDSLRPLYEEISAVLDDLNMLSEIIFINDGSKDGSLTVMRELEVSDSRVRVVEFRRNYGQTAATQAGFDHAEGDIVIAMDADLQNDPGDIPRLIGKLDEGYDVVSGWRKNRQDDSKRVLPSKVANFIINRLISSTGCQLHDYGCTLKAYRNWVVKKMNLYGEMHRFIPAFAALEGAKVAELEVNHRSRQFGHSKYGMDRIFRVLLDLVTIRFFTTSMTRPLHFFGKISRWTIYASLIMMVVLGALHFFIGCGINFNTYLIVLTMCGFVSVQFVILGLLGEIVVRSYFEGSDKKLYSVVDS